MLYSFTRKTTRVMFPDELGHKCKVVFDNLLRRASVCMRVGGGALMHPPLLFPHPYFPADSRSNLAKTTLHWSPSSFMVLLLMYFFAVYFSGHVEANGGMHLHPYVKYGVGSPKFIWASCHVMCTSLDETLQSPHPSALGLDIRGRFCSSKIDDIFCNPLHAPHLSPSYTRFPN
jgi:hypothetical protein